MIEKTYLVQVISGRHRYASTLAEAKKLGSELARLTERNDIKWNLSYVTVVISKKEAVGYYKDTGWHMVFPVRGSGANRESTIASIKKKFGVASNRWFKKK